MVLSEPSRFIGDIGDEFLEKFILTEDEEDEGIDD